MKLESYSITGISLACITHDERHKRDRVLIPLGCLIYVNPLAYHMCVHMCACAWDLISTIQHFTETGSMKECPRNSWKIRKFNPYEMHYVQELIMIISNVQIAFLPSLDSVLALIEKNFWHFSTIIKLILSSILLCFNFSTLAGFVL